MNHVVIKGRLTADPELKTTQTGVETCSFTVAVDRYAGKDKEKTVNFIPCRAWRATAAFIANYFMKGKEILIDGALNIDKYDKDGETRSFAYINVDTVEFCGGKQKPDADTAGSVPAAAAKSNTAFAAVDDDDLPF